MVNGEINNTTPFGNLREILNGAYSINEVRDWTVMVIGTNLSFWERWCQKADSYLLPEKADRTLIAKIFSNDGTTKCQVIQIGQTAIEVDKPCKIEIQKINTSRNK